METWFIRIASIALFTGYLATYAVAALVTFFVSVAFIAVFVLLLAALF